MTIKYATEENPDGKYKKGTIIKITGQKTKVENCCHKIQLKIW